MALSNAEKQKNWRERHIRRRRTVQRITSLLLRQTWSDEHFKTLGGLLQGIMNREAVRHLRRALLPPTGEEMAAINREQARRWQALWLREHPGKTAKDYRKLSGDEKWEWRRAKGASCNRSRAAGMGTRPSGRGLSRARVRP